MNVDIIIDALCNEPKIEIHTNKITKEINDLAKNLSSSNSNLIGYKDELVVLINSNELIRVYGENKKVYAVTSKGKYNLKLRLYEVEERLSYKKLMWVVFTNIIKFFYIYNNVHCNLFCYVAYWISFI